jgi:hypothetical protein
MALHTKKLVLGPMIHRRLNCLAHSTGQDSDLLSNALGENFACIHNR